MYYIITCLFFFVFFFRLILCAFNEQWVSLPDGNLKNTPVDKPDIRFYSHVLCITAKIAISSIFNHCFLQNVVYNRFVP